jgi:ABC-type hemin transport system ATPase subunit
MPASQPHLSSVLLTHRLLWNRALGGPSRPQPVVVLLGPVGSGKSTALKSISGACGAEVVHALSTSNTMSWPWPRPPQWRH